MDAAQTLARLGHVATRRQLLACCPPAELDEAVAAGRIERLGQRRYVTAGLDEQRRLAAEHAGVLSHESAALAHGIAVVSAPSSPWVSVPRNRSRRGHPEACCERRYRDLDGAELRRGVTSPVRTVLDCARDLPLDRALTVADGAVGRGLVGRRELVEAAAALRGPGSARARRVAEHATEHSTGPLESVLRALTIECGLTMTPQLQVSALGLWSTVDLGDPLLRLALEADSFAWHGDRRALDRDCRRYDELVVFGWTVLRFSWEQVMLEPDWVRWCLRHVVAGRAGTVPPPPPAQRRRTRTSDHRTPGAVRRGGRHTAR